MITVVNSPQKYTPSENPIIFQLESDNPDIVCFRIVVTESISGETMFTGDFPVRPDYAQGTIVQLNKILASAVRAQVDNSFSLLTVPLTKTPVISYMINATEQVMVAGKLTDGATQNLAESASLTIEDVYQENTEWTVQTSASGSNFADSTTPQSGTVCISITSFTDGEYLRFIRGSTMDITPYAAHGGYLKMWVKINTSFINAADFIVSFYNSGSVISSTLNGVSHGFNRSLFIWQELTFPISAFTFTSTTFNTVYLRLNYGNAGGFEVDNVRFELPALVTEDIYEENTEWPATTSVGGSFSSTTTPQSGAINIEVPSFINGDYIFFQKTSTLNITHYSALKFWVKINSPFINSADFKISVYNGTPFSGGTLISSECNGVTHGFNRSLLNTWQQLVFPTSDFTFFSNTFDTLLITLNYGNPSGFNLDNIFLEKPDSLGFYVWDSNMNEYIFDSYIQSDYVIPPTIASATKFLTNKPDNTIVSDTTADTLYFLQELEDELYVVVKTYDTRGGILSDYSTPGFGVPGLPAKMFRVLVSPEALNTINDVDFTNVDSYTVHIEGADNVVKSETRTYHYRPTDCNKDIVNLLWINSLGGIDCYQFLNPVAVSNVIRNIIQKNPWKFDGTTYSNKTGNSFNPKEEVINVNKSASYTAYSKVINDREAEWLNELFISKQVFVELVDKSLIPVMVSDTSYTIQKQHLNNASMDMMQITYTYNGDIIPAARTLLGELPGIASTITFSISPIVLTAPAYAIDIDIPLDIPFLVETYNAKAYDGLALSGSLLSDYTVTALSVPVNSSSFTAGTGGAGLDWTGWLSYNISSVKINFNSGEWEGYIHNGMVINLGGKFTITFVIEGYNP